MISVNNLVDLILTCVEHPAAANQVFLAPDGEDISTSDFLKRLSKAMGVEPRLMPVPSGVLYIGAFFVGRCDLAKRLIGSLQVDITKARELLNWSPPLSIDEGLRRCVSDDTGGD